MGVDKVIAKIEGCHVCITVYIIYSITPLKSSINVVYDTCGHWSAVKRVIFGDSLRTQSAISAYGAVRALPLLQWNIMISTNRR